MRARFVLKIRDTTMSAFNFTSSDAGEMGTVAVDIATAYP